MVTLEARQGFGGSKPYVSRITGTDPKFGLARVFLAGRFIRSKSGRTGHLECITAEPGLYEITHTSNGSREPEFTLLTVWEGELLAWTLSDELAYEIAQGLDSHPISALRLFGVPEKERPTVRNPETGRIAWNADADSRRAEALGEIRRLMAEHGITLDDLR